MYVMARLISTSLRLRLPPCGGILRTPSSAVAVSAERPRFSRASQALVSPIFGAPSLPVAWQAAHT
jgi:hypothetical protein